MVKIRKENLERGKTKRERPIGKLWNHSEKKQQGTQWIKEMVNKSTDPRPRL